MATKKQTPARKRAPRKSNQDRCDTAGSHAQLSPAPNPSHIQFSYGKDAGIREVHENLNNNNPFFQLLSTNDRLENLDKEIKYNEETIESLKKQRSVLLEKKQGIKSQLQEIIK